MSIFSKIYSFFEEFVTTSTLVPKSIICLREGYSKTLFRHDLFAGITVGVISLPLAMAFAIGSGVPPERGLFTAVIAGFLISLLGGSRVQIGGPTGAFIVIVYDIVQRQGYDGLALATLIAAAILLVLGLTRCGTYIRFIPYPVTTGFTTGIATSLFIGQMKDFWGLQIPTPAPEFFEKMGQYIAFSNTWNPYALAIGFGTLAIIITIRKISPKIPGVIIAVCIAALVTYLLQLPVDTIEKKFGAIPNMLPAPSLPNLSFSKIKDVFPDAIAIALLGAIESLLSCVVADGMTGFRHRSNTELVAQGIGNIGSVIFGGIPATGAVARTTANVQLGARTPISGMIHAVTVLILMVLFSPYAGKIPMATLSAILIYVAYNMAELEHFRTILKGPKSESLILLTTFSLTVFIDLTIAVQAGVLIASFLFLKNMTEKTQIKLVSLVKKDERAKERADHFEIPHPKGVEIFEIEGPFFFGVSDLLNEALRQIDNKPKVFILRMPTVPYIDVSGMQALKQFNKKCEKQGITFYITEMRHEVFEVLEKSEFFEDISKNQFFKTLPEAVHKCHI